MGCILRTQLLLATLLIFGGLHAQNYTYSLQQYQFEDGLLHRSVSAIYQDKQGFIWIGSPNGLQQFDGHEFKSWFDNDGSGKKTSISKMVEDDKNWLWLWNTANNQFLFLNTITEEVLSSEQRFGKKFPIKNFHDQSGWTFLGDRIPKDSKNRLCFISSNPNQLIYYHSKTGFEISSLPSLKSKTIELKHLSKDNSLWVVEKNKHWDLVKLDAQGIEKQRFQFKENFVLNDFTERNGCIYFTAGDTETEIQYEISANGNLTKLNSKAFFSPEKRFYVTYIWDFNDGKWAVYDTLGKHKLFEVQVLGKKKSLYPLDIRIFEDRKARVWFYGEYGISVLSPKENNFINYFTFESDEKGPAKSSARGIGANQNDVYINFEYYGLLKFTQGLTSKWEVVSNELEESPYLGRALLHAPNSTFYSAHESGIREYNSTIGNYLPWRDSEQFSESAVWCIYKSGEQIWVGREYDFARWDIQLQKYQKILLRNSKGQLVETGEVLQIIGADLDRVWLCTSKGLLLVNLSNYRVLEHYGMLEKGRFNLPVQIFYSMHIDQNNIYWLGTNSGLIRWDKSNNKYTVYNKADGLSNNTIYSVLEDDFGCLWLSSDYGIMRFNKSTFAVSTFLKKDGIADNECNRISYYKAKDGHMYFGGINGVTSFHPKNFTGIKINDNQEILLTNFIVFDSKKNALVNKTGEIRKNRKLTIHPSYKYIRLRFSVPNYEDDYLNTYAWKLGKETEDWITQTDNRIQFDKLPYGEHILFIRGHNTGGKWSKTLEIKLQILRPFYLSTWFILTLIGLLILAIIFSWRRRTAKLKKRARELQIKINEATYKIEQDKNVIQKQAEELLELDKTKSQFYANVSHELRTPLTLVLGPLENVLNNKTFRLPNEAFDMLKLTMLNSKKLQARVDEILDLSKIDAGKLALVLEPVRLVSFIKAIIKSFAILAQKRQISIDFNSEIKSDIVLNSDAVKLEKVISNLLSNALKHTPIGGKITVDFYPEGTYYSIRVQDNGVGISEEEAAKIFERFYQSAGPQSQGGSGIGLALCKELAILMEGDVNLVSTDTPGATFVFKFKADEIIGSNEQQLPLEIAPIEDYEQQSLVTFVEGKPTILVIEDNAEMRYFIRGILDEQYNIIEASDGKIALDKLKQYDVDLITCDIMMPNVNGLEFVAKLKAMASFDNLPVIMLSAKTHLEDKLHLLKLGIDDYMVKPFYSSELLARVNNLISNKRTREQNQIDEQNIDSREIESLWLEKVRNTIEENISNSLYSVIDLCENINIQERTLNRNLRKEIGLSAAAYIKEVRLNRAMEYLSEKKYRSVKEVSSAVGFLRSDYFAKEFGKRFGKKPSDFF